MSTILDAPTTQSAIDPAIQPATDADVSDAPATPEQTTLPTLMTVGEVAEYLRVSEMTIYRMITARRIAATKVGRGWRIAADDLHDYLEECRVPRAS